MLMAVICLALITLLCGLTILSAVAAARAREPSRRRFRLFLQGLFMVGAVGAALVMSFTGGHGKGATAVISLVGLVFGFVLGAGAVYLGYVVSGRRSQFASDLYASLWLTRSGPRRLDGGPTAPS